MQEYYVEVNVAGALAGGIEVKFQPKDRSRDLAFFVGVGGGPILGSGLAWGTAFFNYGVDWLADQRWEARFTSGFIIAGVHVSFTGMSGEQIGHIAAGGWLASAGIKYGAGALFGQGKFQHEPAIIEEPGKTKHKF